MAKINLLPWREERRKELQQQFIVIVAVVAVFAALCTFAVHSYFSNEVSNQLKRNKFVEGEIAALEIKIKEIQALQERRNQIVDSMKVIQQLQGNRPVIVHSLGAIASTIPDGVYYTKIEKKGKMYKMYGIAETNNKISKLMRNLDDSEWFKNPVLVKVEGVKDDAGEEKSSRFEMMVTQEVANQEDEEEMVVQPKAVKGKKPPAKGKKG